MTLLGFVAGGICAAVSISHHVLASAWPVCVLLVLIPPAGFFVACLPTLAFSVRIEEGSVKHVLLDRFVLSNLPAADFERLERVRSPLAVQIVFTRNRKIRFVGAHLGIIGALSETLELAKKTANSGRSAAS